jgi:hypothetical protein
MQDHLDKMDQKLDRIEDKISNIDVTLAKQAKDLEHHIYRTDLAEEQIKLVKEEIQPIKKHVALMDASLRIIGAIASAVTFIAGVYKLLF